jgi:hypothetical protein
LLGTGHHGDSRADLPGQLLTAAIRTFDISAIALGEGFELLAAIVTAIVEVWHRSFLSAAAIKR